MTITSFEGLTQQTCIDIACAQDANDHTGALIILALAVEDFQAARLLKKIEEIEELLGHMPQPLIDLREETKRQMFERLPSDFMFRLETLVALAGINGKAEANVRTYFS